MTTVDVLVIGAGQAGLAMGRELARANRDFVIVDGASTVGESWRRRWDSLRLFTPARHSSLPGLPFPADPDHLPDRDEVARYLSDYLSHFGLPVRLDTAVRHLRQVDGGFQAVTTQGGYIARAVVVATGPFQRPAIPALTGGLEPDIAQLHAADYRNSDQLPEGPVLVVGSGNSGVQIADELARTRPVVLAAGRRQPVLPQRLLGRDVFSWLDQLRVMNIPADSRIGRRMRERDPLIGTGPRALRRTGVRVVDRVAGAVGRALRTADGTMIEPATVIWATGYQPDYSWLDVPHAVGGDGWPQHTAGVSPIPRLHFLGLPYQRTRGSALIGWVGTDAAYLGDRLAR
ncbi:flavin-containing monooxygenase [Jiangella alkaliphila]|uniref:Putative flavoprotein involved in K+ transport n=1 Tax=Jiangella alkaliphila TaxID=419479 RepID=A0A1H2L7Z2_9ACTN|nr:NAD(P)/FAD-dependent oxidoreductase [Jiangella alkaliphila]SDU76566.1 putative flavoprotein involved in K+ transport [Jiangella alkaliphila]